MSNGTKAYIAKKIKKEDVIAYAQQYDKGAKLNYGTDSKNEKLYAIIEFKYKDKICNLYFSNSGATNYEIKNGEVISNLKVNLEYTYTLIFSETTPETINLVKDICQTFGGGYFIKDDNSEWQELPPYENKDINPLPKLRTVTLKEIREKFGEHVIIKLNDEVISAVLEKEKLEKICSIAAHIYDADFRYKFNSLTKDELLSNIIFDTPRISENDKHGLNNAVDELFHSKMFNKIIQEITNEYLKDIVPIEKKDLKKEFRNKPVDFFGIRDFLDDKVLISISKNTLKMMEVNNKESMTEITRYNAFELIPHLEINNFNIDELYEKNANVYIVDYSVVNRIIQKFIPLYGPLY